MSDASWRVPAAILAGSALVAGALVWGRPAPTSAATPPAVPAPAPKKATREHVASQLSALLESHRATMVARCWRPSVAKGPGPVAARYTFDVTLDGATGREITRAIQEDQNAARADVGRCLRSMTDLGLAVDPPGANVRVDVAIRLP